MGCGSMSISDSYHNNVKKNEAERINKAYSKVEFDGDISQEEAEVIFDKYVLDNGWPWKMMGGYTKPSDNGNNWAVKFMDDIGLVNESQTVYFIDKKTGEVVPNQ